MKEALLAASIYLAAMAAWGYGLLGREAEPVLAGVVFVVINVGSGVILGRWRAVLLPGTFVLALLPFGGDAVDEDTTAFDAVIFVAVIAAALIAIGVGIRRSVQAVSGSQ